MFLLSLYASLHDIFDTAADIEELTVLLKEGARTTVLWWLSGNHRDSWHHGEVTVGRIPQDFNILFEASRAFNSRGHIAIDDIDFTNCILPGKLYLQDTQFMSACSFYQADFH